MTDFIFLIHAGATLFLVGLIWTIQVVHYPLFGRVGESGYAAYQTSHMSRITYVVAPVMFAELLTAIYFAFVDYPPIDQKFFWFGLALIALLWLSTMLIQSPIHGRLAEKFDVGLVDKLVWTNWLRTIIWTMRGALILWMIWVKMVKN